MTMVCPDRRCPNWVPVQTAHRFRELRQIDIVVPGQLSIETGNQAAQSGLFSGIGWYEEEYTGPQDEGPHTHVDVQTTGPARWGLPATGPETATSRDIRLS